MGLMAGERLFARIKGDVAPKRRIVLPTQMVIRASTRTTPLPGPRRTCRFGGNGKSGNGSRQSSVWVLDQFTRWQSMNWDYSGSLQRAQIDVAELTADDSFR
jgi:hypothetical protein